MPSINSEVSLIKEERVIGRGTLYKQNQKQLNGCIKTAGLQLFNMFSEQIKIGTKKDLPLYTL